MDSKHPAKVDGTLERWFEETRISRRQFLSSVVTGTVVIAGVDSLAAATTIRSESTVPAATAAQLEAVLGRYGSEFGHVRRTLAGR